MIDIGGPALLRAAAKNFASVTAVCRPSDYEPVLERALVGPRRDDARAAPSPRGDRVREDGRVRLGDRALVPARWRLSGDIRPVVRPRARAPVRREPAPGGGLLRRARRSHASPRVRRPAPGEGALVQQPQRSLRGAPAGVRARGAGVRDREAREPVRGRCRGDDRGGVREGACGRSASPRTEASSSSTARSARALAEALAEQFVEVLFAPAYEAPAARGIGSQAVVARSRARGAARRRRGRARLPARARRSPRPGARLRGR